MNREQALRLLELDQDAPLESAEEAYQRQSHALGALLESVTLKASAREQLDASLARLGDAIDCLRQAPVADQQAVTLFGDPGVSARYRHMACEADPDATRFDSAWTEAESEPVDNESTVDLTTIGFPDESARSSPALPRWTVVAGAGLALLLLMTFALMRLPAEQPITPAFEVGTASGASGREADAERLLRDERGEWQRWGDKLQDRLVRLTTVLDRARAESRAAAAAIDTRSREAREDRQTHPARERLQLIEQYIIDDDYLLLLTRALAGTPPAALQGVVSSRRELERLAGDASLRELKLEQLDQALTARQSVRAQVARLQADGLPEWPPEQQTALAWFEEAAPARVARAIAGSSAAEAAFAEGDFSLAAERYTRAAGALAKLEVTPQGTPDETSERIAELLRLGREAISQNRLSRPADASALYYALEIETLRPGRAEAAELMAGIQRRYIALAHSQLSRGEAAKALRYADMAVAMGADEGEVEGIHAAAAASTERQFVPLRPVTEVEGIVMLTLPLGQFTMGAQSSALDELAKNIGSFLGALFGGDDGTDYSGSNTEVPPHQVAIESWVALSRFEITVAQFRRFIQRTDYRTDAELHGFSYAWIDDREIKALGKNWRHDYLGNPADPDQPVIHVSYRDARAFARWLSSLTGANYRLPSESEFEYAARAGLEDLLPWSGRTPPDGAGNFLGELDTSPPGWRRGDNLQTVPGYRDGHFGPAPVGSATANEFGLTDMLGNVSEWVGDCYNENYRDKGKSQLARGDGDCNFGVVRGSAWSSDVRLLRLSYRGKRPVTYSSNTLGFRVARDVKP